MKAKTLILVQIAALLTAVSAGAVLSTQLADGPRLLHRVAGSLGTISGLVVALYLLRQGANPITRASAWSAFILSGMAGFAGASLKVAENYGLYYATMRVSGGLAVVCAITTLVLVLKSGRPKEPTVN